MNMKHIITACIIVISLSTTMILPAYAEKEVTLVYTEGSTEIASVNVVKAILQEKKHLRTPIGPGKRHF